MTAAGDVLDALAEELIARGLVEHGDFYITGRSDLVPSSEHIGMRDDAGQFRVWYRDMGVTKQLALTSDFAEAREVFMREAMNLARHRGRTVRED